VPKLISRFLFAGVAMLLVSGTASASPIFATLTVGSGDSGFILTADLPGPGGNSISFAALDPNGAFFPLTASLTGTEITLGLATDAGGAIVTTAAQAVAALNASPAISSLVTAALIGNGSGIVAPFSTTNLSGGAVTTAPEPASLILFSTGALGFLISARRRRRA
jgi:hypothetical protein